MPDEKPDEEITPAEQAGEIAEAVVDVAIEETTEKAKTEIDAAQERADAAEATADMIADAALEGAQGAAIRNCEKGIEECRTKQNELTETVSGMQNQMQEMATNLATVMSPPPPEPSPPPTPPPSQEQEPSPEVPVVEPVTAEAESVVEGAQEVVEPERKRKARWT